MAYDEALADRIRELIAIQPEVTEKRMFGGLAFLVGGHMSIAASSRGGLMVRVDPDELELVMAEPHVEPFEMQGRAVNGWVRVDAAGVQTDVELERWVETGAARALSLPPKA